jgi:hypothetical protein
LTKYSKTERHQLRRAVLDCEAAGYEYDEAIRHIKKETGITLSQWMLNLYRRQWKTKAIAYHKHLREDKWAFKLIVHERIASTKRLIEIDEKLLLEVKDDVSMYHYTTHSLIEQIAELNKRLLEYYLLLKSIEANGFDSGSDDLQLPEISESFPRETTKEQSQRKF